MAATNSYNKRNCRVRVYPRTKSTTAGDVLGVISSKSGILRRDLGEIRNVRCGQFEITTSKGIAERIAMLQINGWLLQYHDDSDSSHSGSSIQPILPIHPTQQINGLIGDSPLAIVNISHPPQVQRSNLFQDDTCLKICQKQAVDNYSVLATIKDNNFISYYKENVKKESNYIISKVIKLDVITTTNCLHSFGGTDIKNIAYRICEVLGLINDDGSIETGEKYCVIAILNDSQVFKYDLSELENWLDSD
jgi:hypothetical protein